MFPIMLAAVSAVAFGRADFSGGKASRRADPVAVTVVSQLLSVPLPLLLVLVAPGTPSTVDLAWGLGAGVAANALYLAAAGRGHLSVVAAIAALYPASTVLLALAVDREGLRPVQLAGLGFAADALVLASI
ncbi:EamA family transporter [Micromonospora sp. NPDC047548]|uniref:EamA family transporter n=1 Tax=Micromonospora sp. NPDC047548 TaxID=3155624 RepID=UPI0034097CA1